MRYPIILTSQQMDVTGMFPGVQPAEVIEPLYESLLRELTEETPLQDLIDGASIENEPGEGWTVVIYWGEPDEEEG